MSQGPRGYVSFLLRMWQAKRGRELVWRASLQSSRTKERIGFPSLEALFTFLGQQAGAASDPDGEDTEGRSAKQL